MTKDVSSHSNQIPLIDFSKYDDETQTLSYALSLSLVSKKSFGGVFLDKKSNGLTTYQQQLILFVGSLCDAKVSGVTIGSKEIFFIPQKYFDKKKIVIEEAFSQPQHCSQILQIVLPLLVTQNKKITLQGSSSTYAKEEMSLQMFKETILRFINPLVVQSSLQILEESIYPQQSKWQLSIHSKYSLEQSKPFSISKQPKLICIKALCLFAQDYFNEQEQDHIKKTISLSLQQKTIPFDCNTRTQQLQEPSFWVSCYGLFGNDEGFDNDKADVFHLEKCFEMNPHTDQDLIAYGSLFSQSIAKQEFSCDYTSFLLPIISCIGGKIPAPKKECLHVKIISYISEKLFDNKINKEKDYFVCDSFTKTNSDKIPEENILSIDEL